MTACLFALCASVALAGPPPLLAARAPSVVMGGMEQKLLAARAPSVVMGGMEQKLTPLASGNRVSLQLSGPTASLEPLAQSCVGMARSAGLTGIVYSLERLARLEIVAEGGREHLDALVDHAAAAADVECKVEWQAPVGGYDEAFPLVTLRPQMSAVLGVHGDKRTLDYYTRHLQAPRQRPSRLACRPRARAGGARPRRWRRSSIAASSSRPSARTRRSSRSASPARPRAGLSLRRAAGWFGDAPLPAPCPQAIRPASSPSCGGRSALRSSAPNAWW